MKNIILLTMVFLSSFSTAFSGDILGKRAFTEKYVSVVNNLHPGAETEIVNDLEVKITFPDKKELTSFLDNAYADYKNAPQEIDSVLSSYAESITLSKNLENQKLEKEYIFPVIKDRKYIEQVEEMMKTSDKKGLVYEKLNDVLYVLYAFDTPKAIRFMTESDLADVGVKKQELRDLAKANLKKSIPNLQLRGDPRALSMLVADGMYEASFILFDKIWTKEQFPVQGDIVVYIPSRDLVLITGSNDKDSLAKVHEIVYNPKNQWSHIVAEVGFVRIDGSWRVYKP